jgi:hypothetical protein
MLQPKNGMGIHALLWFFPSGYASRLRRGKRICDVKPLISHEILYGGCFAQFLHVPASVTAVMRTLKKIINNQKRNCKFHAPKR